MKTETAIKRGECAAEIFRDGCNCAQAVFAAFGDLTGFDRETAVKVSSALGGGVCRMREVCGAVSGAMLVLGTVIGGDTDRDPEKKRALYALGQEFCKKFSEECGSIVCRELLGLTEKISEPAPAARTDEYYKKRPCAELVRLAAELCSEIVD